MSPQIADGAGQAPAKLRVDASPGISDAEASAETPRAAEGRAHRSSLSSAFSGSSGALSLQSSSEPGDSSTASPPQPASTARTEPTADSSDAPAGDAAAATPDCCGRYGLDYLRHPVAAYGRLPTPLRQLLALPTPLKRFTVAARPTIEPSGAAWRGCGWAGLQGEGRQRASRGAAIDAAAPQAAPHPAPAQAACCTTRLRCRGRCAAARRCWQLLTSRGCLRMSWQGRTGGTTGEAGILKE